MVWLRRTVRACALCSIIALANAAALGETILLDFQTDWCGYCRMMEPVVQEMVAEGYQIRTVNGDRQPELVSKFRIEGYPTFVALRDGHEVGRLSGKTSKAELCALMAQAGTANGPRASDAEGATMRGQSPDRTTRPRIFGGRRLLPGRETVTASAKVESADAGGWESADPINAPADSNSSDNINHLLTASVRLHIQDEKGRSTGSGTIIDARGGESLILTCGHMFREYQESSQILVDFFGPDAPTEIHGTLVSYDLNSDIGLVRVAADYPFVAAKVASPDCQCRPGDHVMSVGCDNGREATPVATTIVSVNRYNHAPNLQVAFEPVQGRSGGGLFNARGEVIGVCNAADAEDKQGLFAALAAIHRELDRTKLSFVYGGNTSLTAARGESADLAAASDLHPSNVAREALSKEELALLQDLRSSRGAEVICLVRTLDDPQAKSRVLQINRASPAFWRELAAVGEGEPAHKLTSLDSRLPGDAPPTGDASAATLFSAHKNPMPVRSVHADRVWPPRQTEQ